MAKKNDKENSKKQKSLWKKLFPTFMGTDDSQNNIEVLPTSTGFLPGESPDSFVPKDTATPTAFTATTSDTRNASVYPIKTLPYDRLAKYAIYDVMMSDPTIESAVKMHIANALSVKTETGDILNIESATDKDDPIVNDLRDTFKHILNRELPGWMYNCAIYGASFCRLYGDRKAGVKHIRNDYYTQARFMKIYERAGQTTGFTNAYQLENMGKIRIMAPWEWVAFRIPLWRIGAQLEPVRVDTRPFDITSEDPYDESLVETQNYGKSLIESAYSTWIDLMEAILSLNMSRKNAARMERLVGVNTGKLSPQRAAQYLNTVAEQFLKSAKAKTQDSLRRGYVQLTDNLFIPIWGDSKGRLDLSTIEPNPNITAIQDIDFIINRLCSALGVDKSLVGFGESLSGGLGEGGYFRLSLLAAIKAHLIRSAAAHGIERLFDIHVMWKFGKYYLPGHKPWRIMFNSVSSALEREEQENNESRMNAATAFGGIIQLLDPEYSRADMKIVDNFVYTDILKIDEEKFKEMFPGKAPAGQVAPGMMGEQQQGGEPGEKPFPDEPEQQPPGPEKPEKKKKQKAVTESAVKDMVYEAIKDIYQDI